MLSGALRKQWENVQDFPNLACQQVLRWAGMIWNGVLSPSVD